MCVFVRLIDPLKGKQRVENVQAAKEHLVGSSFKGHIPKGWSDMKRPSARKVIPKHIKENPTAREVITGIFTVQKKTSPQNHNASTQLYHTFKGEFQYHKECSNQV